MKKIGVIIASGVLVCATVAGFLFATKPWENHSSEESQMAENDNKGNKSEDKKDDKETKDSQGSELSDPILEWWELYNPNGFNTFTGVISNPNNIAVDVTYDLVYYKNGEEVVRNEDFANFSILPGGKSIVWANWDIPESSKVDEVKMETTFIGKTNYPPINGKYSEGRREGNSEIVDFEFEEKPTVAEIIFLLYNDYNKNGKFDKGEIVGTSIDNILDQKKGSASFDVDVSPFTNYEVYFTAY